MINEDNVVGIDVAKAHLDVALGDHAVRRFSNSVAGRAHLVNWLGTLPGPVAAGVEASGDYEKRYSADFKAKVALEAIRGDQTLAELSARHDIHHTVIPSWKRQAVAGMASSFDGSANPDRASSEAEMEKLHAKIGQLVVERDFLAKAFGR